MEESYAKLGNGEEKRLRCTEGQAPTSSSKELYLVSQDNVVNMARQVEVCDTPARSLRRVCFNTGLICHICDDFWAMSFGT